VTVGDGHSGIGRTLHTWDKDVERLVHRVHQRFGRVTTNTYSCHPFCGPPGNRQGWARRSIDVWGAGGRGDALPPLKAQLILDFLFTMPDGPLIRHYILEHDLWTRWGGHTGWAANDHSGRLRHVHVTYLPVPAIA
jgi:hypothetical protein